MHVLLFLLFLLFSFCLCLPRFFLPQFRRRQRSQLVVNQRQQLISRRRITRFDLRQDVVDVRHWGLARCIPIFVWLIGSEVAQGCRPLRLKISKLLEFELDFGQA